MTLCQCGCKGEAKPGNKYIQHHHWKGRKLSEEHKRKISIGNKGKIVSEETREKMSKGYKGKKLSDETKLKISKAHKEKHHTQETKDKISKALKGRHLSIETRKKMSESCKDHVVSEETRKKISESNIIYGKVSILKKHRQYKKEECIFGCENEKYCLHHEPPIEENILKWEGQLINLCRSCHKKTHADSLKFPDNVDILWTKEDTEKELNTVGV